LLEACLLNLADLLGDELLSHQVAAQLSERVGRDRLSFRRAQMFEALRCVLELRIEVADPEPRQGCLTAVDDSGVLGNVLFRRTIKAS
jgi:hypothetical protein